MPTPTSRSFQWHPHVHELWAGERLHFWFIKYDTIYDQRKYVREIEELFERCGILSYTIYELTGGFDLLIRVWVPKNVRGDEIEDDLSSMANVSTAENFKVRDTERHWPWRSRSNGHYEIIKPEPLHIDAGFVNKDLAALNATSLEVKTSQQRDQQATERRQFKRNDIFKLLREYEAANMLTRPKYGNRGIKSVVIVTAPKGNRKQLENVTTEICSILDGACRRGTLNEASLYFGKGLEASRYLILARVPHLKYHEMSEWLLNPINRFLGATTTRTVTYTISTPGFVAHREVLPVPDAVGPAEAHMDTHELLALEESQTFEVKGSGLVNLERWIKGSGEFNEESKVTDSVARAIVALLNSDGGVVLIGALEETEFPEDSDERGHLGKFENLRIGNYLCIGVDKEMKRRKGWDPYVRHLRRELLNRIGGGGEFWIEEFQKRVVKTSDGGLKTLVVIPVKKPDEWFWLKGQDFVIRRGPESPTLNGPGVNSYQRITGERGGWRSSAA